MSWQILTIISVVSISISILLQRVLLHKDKSDPIAYVVVFQGLVGVLIGIYSLIVGFEMPDFGTLWFPSLICIVFFGIGHVTYAKTLQLMEASVFSVFFALYVFWVMLFGAVWFREQISPLQVVGALLIFSSIILVSERRGAFKFDRGTSLGLLTGLFFGIAVITWAYVGRRADANSWNALSFIGPSLFVLATHPGAAKDMKPILRGDSLKRMVLLAIFFSINGVALLAAYQVGEASLIAPLHATSTIVTVLLAVLFLRERTRLRWKAAAATVCFVGALMVV